MSRSLLAAGVVLAIALWACGAQKGVGGSEVLVSDSAGLTVVDISGPLAGVSAEAWTLDRVFSTSRTGVELYRVTAGRILSDGRILVGDGGNSEILILDAEGELLGRLGREGDGPGEFRAITSLHPTTANGFSLYDTSLGRWTHFDSSGVVTSTEPMSPPNRVVDLVPLAKSESHQLLAIYGDIRRFARDGIRRDTTPLLHYVEITEDPDTVGLWAGDEWAYSVVGAGAARTYVGFGRSLASFGRNGLAVLGDTDRLSVSLFDAAGSELMRIRGGGAPIPTTEAEGERWREMRAEALGADVPDDFRERFRRAPFRDSYPAFDAVAVDGQGRVWIGTTARLGSRERQWLVFDRSGSAIARVTVPSGADILDIAHGLVLLRETDDLGVPTVSLHALSDDL